MAQNVNQILVVGASSGIGLAVARSLVESGANVIGIGRRQSTEVGTGQFADLLRNPKFTYNAIDMAEPGSVARVRELIGETLDGLVVTAGSGSPSSEELAEAFQKAIELNILPIVNAWSASKNALESRMGSAVFVSSIAEFEDINAPVEYAMAKASVGVLGKILSRRFPQIRVNVVSPGNVLTEGSVWRRKSNAAPIALKKYLDDNVPQARLGNPEEIADLIMFLLGPQASFITGETIKIDGGQTRGFK